MTQISDDDIPVLKNIKDKSKNALKVGATKKRNGSHVVDVEAGNVEDLRTNTKKQKTTADIPHSMTEDEWLNDWESANCDFVEYYEDDDCYCPVCQGTCQCIPEECTCSRH